MLKKLSLFGLCAYFFVFILFFLAPIDTDLGWHLRYGANFFHSGSFLKTNTLTYFLPGYFWPNSYSLYQIIIYFLYKNFGLLSLTFFSSLFGAACFYFLNKIYPMQKYTNFLGFLAVSLFGWNTLYAGVRAQEFTFLFLIVTFFALKSAKRKYLYLLPLVFVFWVNLHGGFILGLLLIFLHLLDLIFTQRRKELTQIALLLGFCFLGSLINPYGLSIYKEVLRHFNSNLGNLIAEWVSPNVYFKTAVVALSLSGVFYLTFDKAKQKFFWSLLIVSFAYLAFIARRNLDIFALFVFLFVCEQFPQFFKKLEAKTNYANITILLLIAGFILVLPRTFQNYQIANDWTFYCQKGMLPLPCKAVEYIKQNMPDGQNVFSSYEWGGFLEWQLPTYKFFVDGRTPAWPTPEGKSPYTIYLEIIQARDGYQEALDKYHTDWLLVPADTFLDIKLYEAKGGTLWHEIYRDQISAIYIKNSGP
jgi:hypothetical protein